MTSTEIEIARIRQQLEDHLKDSEARLELMEDQLGRMAMQQEAILHEMQRQKGFLGGLILAGSSVVTALGLAIAWFRHNGGPHG